MDLLGLWTVNMSEKRELRSWRERIATPLKGAGDAIPDILLPNKPTNPQTPDSLRVGLWEKGGNKPKQTTADPCVISGCTEPIAEGDLVYCADHRIRADDGSLWLRCVFDGGHAVVAPNDPIACPEHRARMDEQEVRG